MKRWPAALAFLPLLSWGSTPAADGVDSFFERYRQMALFSRVEDAFATDRGFWPRGALRVSSPSTQGGARFSELPRQRAEWAARLGAGGGRVGFDDLATLEDPALVDGALWALLQARAPDPFAPDVDWTVESRPFRNYLRVSKARGLDKQLHGPWWIWFRDGRLVGEADPLLKAVHFYVQGRVLRGTLKIEAWAEARMLMTSSGEPTDNLDRRIFAGLAADGLDPFSIIEVLSNLRRKDFESARPSMLRSFARALRQGEMPRVSVSVARRASVRAEAQALLLRTRSQDKPTPTELLNLALLEAEIGEHGFAERFARAALEAGSAEGGGREDLGFLSKALETLAFSMQKRAEAVRDPAMRRRRMEWVAEHTRRALEIVGRSRSREKLLFQYAAALGELGAREEAARVYDDLFQESVEREAKVGALAAQLRFLEGWLPVSGAARPELFRRFLAKASLLNQWSVDTREKRWALARARFWAQKTGLAGDRGVRASLREMEGR